MKQIEPELVQQISNAFLNDESTQQIRDQELAALRQCIREADPEQQLVLNMRYSTKSSFAEIAERIGKTEGAVQRAMSRLRKRLHDCVHSKLLAAQG